MRSFGLDEQGEMFGDAERAGNVECCTGVGKIAHGAVDRAAAELNGSGFQHTVPGFVASLVHSRQGTVIRR